MISEEGAPFLRSAGLRQSAAADYGPHRAALDGVVVR
jgi:hypothetical protein